MAWAAINASKLSKGVPIWQFCRCADIDGCRYADIADIFRIQIHRKKGGLADILPMWLKTPHKNILKMFADNRYADIEKKCRYCRCRYKYRQVLKTKE